VVRTHTQINAMALVPRYGVTAEEELAKKIKLKKSLINKILPYSAIKITAKPTLPYSILNPETNSDSPSAKSKGVRLVSARQETNQIPTKGRKRRSLDQRVLRWTAAVKLKEAVIIK